MDKIAVLASKQKFAVIPEFTLDGMVGIESRRILEAQEEHSLKLNEHGDMLDEWREHVIQLLLKPLVDEDLEETTGEEYEDSTKFQDEILVYSQMLRTSIADRHTLLSGQQNALVDHEIRTAEGLAKEGNGPAPEQFLKLMELRKRILLDFKSGQPLNSVRAVVSELRALSSRLRRDAGNSSSRAEHEFAIAEAQMKHIHAQLSRQLKATAAMDIEVERFTNTLNARMDYYRQLQDVSDMVAEFNGVADEAALTAYSDQENLLRGKLATVEAKQRYRTYNLKLACLAFY
jgi:E3 ubiquitin-protein ligase SHPRH